MKRLFLIIILTINCLQFVIAQNSNTVDEIVAVVGKEIITRSELEEEFGVYLAQTKDISDEETVRAMILEHMMRQKLFTHQAQLDSVEFSDAEVDARVNYQFNYWLSQVGGNTKIIEEAYHKSIDEIKKDMRPVIREQMIAEQIQQTITANVTITPSEVKKFFDKIPYDSLPIVQPAYEFGHIVKMPPVSEEEIAAIKERLNGFRERVLNGEKFSMLARLYSDDPGSAPDGGELGFVERGTLYPEFEAVAFNLKSGEISQVVKTKAGYHIIQMIERRGDKINVAHILLQPKPSADEQVRAIEWLDSVRQVIINEEMEFSAAALKYSDDQNKNSGGWVVNPYTNSYKFEKEAIDASTFATLSKLIPGQYSEPVAYVTEDGQMAYRIKGAALEEKKQGLIHDWILEKVKVTNIRINENYRNYPFLKEWGISE